MRFFGIIKKINIVKKTAVLGILFLFIFSIFGTLAYAQTATPAPKLDCTKEYCALTTIPGAFDACKADKNGVVTCGKGTVKNPVTVIKNIYGISIGIGAMLAIVMIIWAGIQYATTEAITGKSDAKEKWQGAVFGLVLLLASYIILRTINVDLVNINLDLGKPIECTPTKDADGEDIPCGADSDALGKFLDTIDKNAKAAIATYQTAQQNSADAQKKVTDLQAKLNSIDEKLKDIPNQASQEAKTLVNEASEIKKQLDSAKQEAKKVRTDAQLSTVSASSAKGFSDIAKAVNAGDIVGAQSMKNSTEEVLNREINTLKNSGASANDVNKATATKIVFNGISNQQITIAKNIRDITNGLSYSGDYNLSKDISTQQKIIAARQSLSTQFSATEVQIRAKDPNQLKLFEQQTLEQRKAFDSKVSQIVRCPKGINVSSTNVTCKN